MYIDGGTWLVPNVKNMPPMKIKSYVNIVISGQSCSGRDDNIVNVVFGVESAQVFATVLYSYILEDFLC